MNKRLKTGALLLIPIVLIALFCTVPLAKPEQTHDWENRLIGFYLVRDQAGSNQDYIGDPQYGWEEAGTDTVSFGGIGNISLPKMILKAQTNEDGELYFPTLEGRRFFLAKEYGSSGTQEEFSYRLYSDLESSGLAINITDSGTTHTASGTLYYTAPLDAPTWTEENNTWIAINVWQQPDGTVYLEDNRTGFVGTLGSSIRKTVSYQEAVNGKTTEENTLDLTVNLQYIPRLEKVIVEQFTADHRPLTTKTFTAQEMLNGPSEAAISLTADTAYTLVCEYHTDGSVQRTLLDTQPEPISHTCWPALDSGLTLPCTITLP